MGMHPYSGIKNRIAGSACMRSRRFLPYTLQTDVHVTYEKTTIDIGYMYVSLQSIWQKSTRPHACRTCNTIFYARIRVHAHREAKY